MEVTGALDDASMGQTDRVHNLFRPHDRLDASAGLLESDDGAPTLESLA